MSLVAALLLLTTSQVPLAPNPFEGCSGANRVRERVFYTCGDDLAVLVETTPALAEEAEQRLLDSLHQGKEGTFEARSQPLTLPGWSGPAQHFRMLGEAGPVFEGDALLAAAGPGSVRLAACASRAPGEPTRCPELLGYLAQYGFPPKPALPKPQAHFLDREVSLPAGCKLSDVSPVGMSAACGDGVELRWAALGSGGADLKKLEGEVLAKLKQAHPKGVTTREESCTIEGAKARCRQFQAGEARIYLASGEVRGKQAAVLCGFATPALPEVCRDVFQLAPARSKR